MGERWRWVWLRFAPELVAALAGAVMLGVTAFEFGRDWLGLVDADGKMQSGTRWAWVLGFALVAHVTVSLSRRFGSDLKGLRKGVLQALTEGGSLAAEMERDNKMHAADGTLRGDMDSDTQCALVGRYGEWERRWHSWLAVEGDAYDFARLFREQPPDIGFVPGRNGAVGRVQIDLGYRLGRLREMRSMLALGIAPAR